MQKSKTIVKIMISGYYGFNNTGDEAILKSMVRVFKEKLPRVKIVVLSQNPLQTSQSCQVKAINRLHLISILKCFRDTNLFISGGGGLLQDSTGRGWSILYYLGLILGAILFKVPVMIYAQGIGPINKKLNKLLIKWILNKIDIITVRDIASKELLKSMGVLKPEIYVSSDSSFLLKKKSIDHIIKNFPDILELTKSNNYPLVGISIREYKGNRTDLKRMVARLADDIIEKYKVKIIFLPFKFNEDLHISEEILFLMKNKSQANILKARLEPEELLFLVSQLSLMIGMRLHSIIFSSMVNIPFIALNYDPKVKNFVQDLDLTELLLELNDISLKIFRKKVEYVWKNSDKIKKILAKKTKDLEKKAIINNDMVFKILKI